jgi:hemoglobin-like flavoprotein
MNVIQASSTTGSFKAYSARVHSISVVQKTYRELCTPDRKILQTFMGKLSKVDKDLAFYFAALALKRQARLIKAVEMIIANLDDRDKLRTTLAAFVARPSVAGIRDIYYAPVGNALLATLEIELGEACTAEVRVAWFEEYRRVVSVLEELVITPRYEAV